MPPTKGSLSSLTRSPLQADRITRARSGQNAHESLMWSPTWLGGRSTSATGCCACILTSASTQRPASAAGSPAKVSPQRRPPNAALNEATSSQATGPMPSGLPRPGPRSLIRGSSASSQGCGRRPFDVTTAETLRSDANVKPGNGSPSRQRVGCHEPPVRVRNRIIHGYASVDMDILAVSLQRLWWLP